MQKSDESTKKYLSEIMPEAEREIISEASGVQIPESSTRAEALLLKLQQLSADGDQQAAGTLKDWLSFYKQLTEDGDQQTQGADRNEIVFSILNELDNEKNEVDRLIENQFQIFDEITKAKNLLSKKILLLIENTSQLQRARKAEIESNDRFVNAVCDLIDSLQVERDDVSQ